MPLPVDKDPVGHAIADFYKNKKADHLWVYSDICEKDEIPVSYLFRSFKKMPNIEQHALKFCTGKILDIGAAAGAHSLYLQKQNKEVTALEISELAIQTMKKRGVTNLINADFYKYKPEIKFDTLLFVMNGIGIAGTLKNLNNFFTKCSELLQLKGQVLLDSSDLIYMFDKEDDKPVNKYYGEVRYVMSYKDIISDAFNWLFIDFETLRIKAYEFGFKCEKIVEGKHYNYLARLTFS